MSSRRELLIEGTTEAAGMRAMGPLFVDELREDGESPDSPPGVKRDWFTVAAWLGHKGGVFTKDQRQQIIEGWTAYIAIGLAPSAELQPIFDSVSNGLENGGSEPPPKEVMDVFDRLLATDVQIREKRASDLKAERKKFQRIFQEVKPKKGKGLWRSRDANQRQWIFISVVWFAAVFAYAWLFDPFDVGGWSDLEDEHMYRLYAIALLPVIAVSVLASYRKLVR